MTNIIECDSHVAGTHALIIGVSNYPYLLNGSAATDLGMSFNLGQLSSAASSASKMAQWLLTEYHNPSHPLQSLHILLSPSENESINSKIKEKLENLESSPLHYHATRKNAEEEINKFKNLAKNPNNFVIVYMAGHGIQFTSRGAYLLLEDIGAKNSDVPDTEDYPFYGSINIGSLHGNMNHPKYAKNQIWLIDTCRQKLELSDRFEVIDGPLSWTVDFKQTECSLLIMAAGPLEKAFARVSGVSLFCEAFFDVISWGGRTGPLDLSLRYVSSLQLIADIKKQVSLKSRAEGVDQIVTTEGPISEILFHLYKDEEIKYRVPLTVLVIPSNSTAGTTTTLSFKNQEIVFEGPTQSPLLVKVKPGLYCLKIEPFSNRQPFEDIFAVDPPSDKYVARLS